MSDAGGQCKMLPARHAVVTVIVMNGRVVLATHKSLLGK
jgi:hypothetical protein